MKEIHPKVRRITQVLIVFAIFSTNIQAQEFEYGLQTGLVVANSHLAFDPTFEESERGFDPIISFGINGYIGYRSGSFWVISTEPGYIQKGSLQVGNEDDSSDDVRTQCHYLQLPILFKTNIMDALYFSLGPELGYLLRVNTKPESVYDLDEFYDQKFELSGIIGLGITILNNLDLELRYNHGITYKMKTDFMHGMGTEVLEGTVRDYNEYTQLLVRYRF